MISLGECNKTTEYAYSLHTDYGTSNLIVTVVSENFVTLKNGRFIVLAHCYERRFLKSS